MYTLEQAQEFGTQAAANGWCTEDVIAHVKSFEFRSEKRKALAVQRALNSYRKQIARG